MIPINILLRTVIHLLPIIVSCCVHAAENDTVLTAPSELAVLGGYGITHSGYGETKTEVQTVDLILRYGHFLSAEKGLGSWYQGRHEVLLELPYHLAINRNGRSMVGGTILGSWKFTGYDQVTPYLLWGGGILYVDLGIPTMGRRLDGTYQFGGGLQHFLTKNLAFNGEYRFHHISNLNTSPLNEPLNSSKLLFGLAYYR